MEAVQSLLAAGASPSASDALGRTAAHFLDLRDCLHSGSDGPSTNVGNFALVARAPAAAAAGAAPPNASALAIIAALRGAGADLTLCDAQGFSPLARVVALQGLAHQGSFGQASARPAEAVVRALLAAGARAACALGRSEGNNGTPKPSALKASLERLSWNSRAEEEGCARALIEHGAADGAAAAAAGCGGEDCFAEACAVGRYGLARLLLRAEATQPSVRALLERARAAAPAPMPAFGAAPPRAFAGFGGAAAAADADANANGNANVNANEDASSAGPPPFTQEDLLLCCSLNHTEGIRAILDPNGAQALSIPAGGAGGSRDSPLTRAVTHDCAEAMSLLLVRVCAPPK